MNGLEICNLSFSYGHREVLKNISFRVQQGSFCAFLGGNGAGKSTLVRQAVSTDCCAQTESVSYGTASKQGN